MPVLMIGEVPNLTEEIYAGMVGQMMPLMQAAKGFISHAGGPGPAAGGGSWRSGRPRRTARSGLTRTSSPTFLLGSCRTGRTTRSTPHSPGITQHPCSAVPRRSRSHGESANVPHIHGWPDPLDGWSAVGDGDVLVHRCRGVDSAVGRATGRGRVGDGAS